MAFGGMMKKTREVQDRINKLQRERRATDGNVSTRKYEKTKRGFLMRTYRNMQSRVTGVQHKKAHLYLDKSLLEREEFYGWANGDKGFNSLFKVWEMNNYEQKLTPSIDRVESSRGYDLDNMRWLTHSENSRLGAISKRRGK